MRSRASAAAQITQAGGRARAFSADLRDVDQAIGLVDRAINFLGGIDIVVNNAGITFNKPFIETTPAQFDTLFHVNIRAQYFIIQRALPHMLDCNGGAVCNLTSVHGIQGAPEHSIYAATKGAIIAFTRQLGIELAHKSVRVNAIAPGWIEVENHYKADPQYSTADACDAVPVGRAGKPIDIARLAVFLCSGDAAFIIGQTIVCDGGTTSLMSLIKDFRTPSAVQFGADYVS